jgi:hypothetical protein
MTDENGLEWIGEEIALTFVWKAREQPQKPKSR